MALLRLTSSSCRCLQSVVNLGTLIFLILGLLGLFGCYPIVYSVLKHQESSKGGASRVRAVLDLLGANSSLWHSTGFNLGGVNASGQMFSGMRGLIDPDTPAEVMERMSADGKTRLKLVFSDEFETPGRSFVSTTMTRIRCMSLLILFGLSSILETIRSG